MSLPSYASYRDSDDPLVPAAPAHWYRSALKRLASYQNGYAFKPEDWSERGLPIIRIAQLTSDSEPNYFSGTLDEKLKVSQGDLLFSWSATIDSFIWAAGDSWLNQHIFKVSPTEEATKSYLFYLIKFLAPKLAEIDAHGSTMRHIKRESLGQLVFVPPIPEQHSIAAFLDRETAKIDALIVEQEKLIALLAEKRQATISHAVTRGLNPNVPMSDSGVAWLGEVPAHWDLPPLYMRYSAELGKMLDAGRITGQHLVPYLRNVDVQWDDINYADLPSMDIEVTEYERYTVREGDLLVCEGGEVGRAAVVEANVGVIGFQKALHRLRALSPRECPRYMFYTFAWASHAGAFAGEGQSTIAHLTGEQLRKYRFPRPPLAEQQAIARFLDVEFRKLNGLTTAAARAISLLKERRSALITAAVTGQIDVRDQNHKRADMTEELAA